MIYKLFKQQVDRLVKDEVAATLERERPLIRKQEADRLEAERKPGWKEGCDFLFHHDGQNYYKYKNEDGIHIQRMEKSAANMILLGNRLNYDELGLLCDIGRKGIENCINVVDKENRLKHLEKVIFVFEEMQVRAQSLMFHPDIMLDLLALNIIREDENPAEINDKIHREKKELFKTEGGGIPFLVSATLKTYLPDYKEYISAITKSWELHVDQVQKSTTTYQKIYSGLKSETI